MRYAHTTIAALALASAAAAAPALRVENREFNGRPRDIVVMENDRVLVEVVPSDSGQIAAFRDKTRAESAFEWFDDCPYHYACRWEGFPFEYTTDTATPGEVSVTVTGGGKITVGGIRGVTGIAVAAPIELSLSRKMTLRGDTSRLDVEVKVTNVGDGVAPRFRYMLHGVWGRVATTPFAFILPLPGGTEFFDSARASDLFREAIANQQANNLSHPFSRFVPDVVADKPRFDPGSWVALLTAAGPNYMQFDKSKTDFFQYWYGGDGAWHWTSEPHSKPVDLAPGDSTDYSFAFACDAADIEFDTPTLAYGRVEGPAEASPGDTVRFSAACTTARDTDESASVDFFIDAADGSRWLSASAAATVRNFAFGDLSAEIAIPEDAPDGTFAWRAIAGDGRELARGSCEVMPREEMARRKAERAVEAVRKPLQERIDRLEGEARKARRGHERWRDGANLLATLRDVDASADPGTADFVIIRGATAVAGDWKPGEALRVKAFSPAPHCALPAAEVAALVDARLATMADGGRRASLRDVAVDASGRRVAAAFADAASHSAAIFFWDEEGRVRELGRYAERPGETDDSIGFGVRAVSFDPQGRIWVATPVWGMTTRFVAGPDGQPSEQACEGWKGAVKVFEPNGALAAATPLLDAPLDIAPALADGAATMLVPYRNVSEYHGAMVREGVAILDAASAARLGEVKTPSGSVAVDAATGGLWAADVAGHISIHAARGKGLAQLNDGTQPAVAEAVLPEASLVPARLRALAGGSVAVARPMRRAVEILRFEGGAAAAEPVATPEDVGTPITVVPAADGMAVIGESASAAIQ